LSAARTSQRKRQWLGPLRFKPIIVGLWIERGVLRH
jgi:hypothetical protein